MFFAQMKNTKETKEQIIISAKKSEGEFSEYAHTTTTV
jgi:hypothetical protein